MHIHIEEQSHSQAPTVGNPRKDGSGPTKRRPHQGVLVARAASGAAAEDLGLGEAAATSHVEAVEGGGQIL